MKKKFFLLIISGLISSFAVSCDSNNSGTAGALIGNYRLYSLLLKDQAVTLYAGQINDWMGGETTISGTLSLSAQTYSLLMTIEMNSFGVEYSTTTQDDGTYTANDSAITMTSDDGETQTVYNYSFEGIQLILENDSEERVFTRI
ncbi:MAG: hypothetical protein A2V66_11630 [Ignavibacteria bacterium RBG_13_36_8]|nr:MAG: hypothetical protein A2V66_11630 [Ignavibacteria bacterium RBG_13_36_8]